MAANIGANMLEPNCLVGEKGQECSIWAVVKMMVMRAFVFTGIYLAGQVEIL